MDRLDELVRELAEIKARLDAIPKDDPARRPLEVQRTALKAEANELSGGVNRKTLENHLARLEKELAMLERQRIDVVGFSGGGSMGGDFGFAADAMRLNKAIDKAKDKEGLEAQIRALRDRLAELE